jgi:hypothetical protein
LGVFGRVEAARTTGRRRFLRLRVWCGVVGVGGEGGDLRVAKRYARVEGGHDER